MKISNKYSPNFQAGLTKQMQQEISSCNIQKISAELDKIGIRTDFKNNKVVAWCSVKTVEIIQGLNKQFKLNLVLPNGIFVEDFKKLNIKELNAIGFCNVAPTIFDKKSNIVVPEKTLFFNEFPETNYKYGNYFWDNLDELADSRKEKYSATDFFLDFFIHEFSHVIHENHLLNTLGGKKTINLFQDFNTHERIEKFRNKYFEVLGVNCCYYAASHPAEAIACDMSKRICDCLNKNNLRPETNFIEHSPYREFNLKENLFAFFNETKYNKIIRCFWNGNFK